MKALHNFILFITIVLFTVSTVQAFPKVIWHSGQVTLWNKTVLTGNLSYNWLAEIVMIQTDDRVATLSADQVYQFSWFDDNQNKNREFRSLSLPGALEADRARPAFFEICSDGSLAVVRRLGRSGGLFKRVFGHPSNFTDEPTMAKNADQFDYFVLDAGRLVSLNGFYMDIYKSLMIAYDGPLQKYVRIHNINSRSLLGRLVIINQYNYLVQQDDRTASFKQYGQMLD